MKHLQTDSQWVMRPTRMTLFFRTFLLWQVVRFFVINLRMLIMLARSHPHRLAGGDTRAKPVEQT